MLIKLARPPRRRDLLTLAREMREHGRNAIWVASDLLRGEKAMTSRALVTITEPARPARARRGAVRAHGQRVSRRRSASRAAGAKWTARASWACCCSAAAQGSADHHHRRRPRRAGGDRRAVRAGRARLRRGVMRLTGLGVSPGIGIGKALVLKRGTRDLRFRVPASLVDRELERLRRRARAVARADRADQGRASREQRRRGARLHLRRPAADARRPDADRAGRRRSSGASGSTPSRRCSARSSEISALFDEARTATCASAKATSPTSSAGCA